MTWAQSNVTIVDLYAVVYADGVWVASNDSAFYYSTDGMTWAQSNVTSGYFYVIVYANGVWVAGGSGKGLYYSVSRLHELGYIANGDASIILTSSTAGSSKQFKITVNDDGNLSATEVT